LTNLSKYIAKLSEKHLEPPEKRIAVLTTLTRGPRCLSQGT